MSPTTPDGVDGEALRTAIESAIVTYLGGVDLVQAELDPKALADKITAAVEQLLDAPPPADSAVEGDEV
ncbi:hypothetical protein [Streptomyces erythrochromogenes]|uniref:hypothetical protein n=1 Tax=Streptomyces erythrochromogenes TaxID=285574 RepID=UPI003694562F